ncbi:fimbrillin family protein [Parabacteroides sp. GYB001]|uniref:fimbrillin family protein n=1 Tax=Parabacteroides leei TaxID=2939491 RepID=UPI002016D7D2|nr:fimbrillin family protein [Parabacteroides leei]MCL3853998.1 fimbrillin family protein [Parabacteroides leei]
MNKLMIKVFAFLLPAITGCSDGSGREPLPAAETMVSLEGAIGLSTRVVINSGYEADLDICFARQDEIGNTYGRWSLHKAVRSGGGGNRPIQFDIPQLYPADGSHIRLHGYYPVENDVDALTGKVTFTLDGMTDIMATGCLSATAYAPVRTCLFRHLLTQVGLVCYSDCAALWGEIVKIEAMGVHTRQELDCAGGSPLLTDVSSAEAIKNVTVQGIEELSVPQVDEGGEVPEAQGYVLLPVSLPVGTGGNPLRLEITTTKDGKGNGIETVTPVSVTVENGFRAGKRHVISLFFTAGTGIRTSFIGVEPWTDQDAGELPI